MHRNNSTADEMVPLAWAETLAERLNISVYRLGIRGTERARYWALLFWALFRRPELFPLAVTLAIYGYHCRLVTELRVQV